MTVEPKISEQDRLDPSIVRLLTLLISAAFVVILNETIMGIALPRLMADLDITPATGQWLTTAFMLTMAVVIPLTGSVMDRFSTRTVFITAMSLFTVGTTLAAIAPGFEVLLVGRVVQAMGTALMMPMLMTTVMTFVPARRRGSVMGLISVVISVAPAIGPTISGLILSVLPWRWIFIFMIPIALTALIVGAVMVRNVGERRPTRFDVLSVVLSALGFSGVIYGLSSFGEASTGETIVSAFIPLAIGVLALTGFVLRQRQLQRTDTALLDLRPLASRAFTTPLIMALVCMAVMFGVIILLPLYLQQVVGLNTLQSGLMLLPGGLAMGVLSPYIGRLFDRFGPRPLLIPGSIVLALTCWGFVTVQATTPLWLIVVLHVVLSASLALCFTPLMATALAAVPGAHYSHGSAIFSTGQQLAGAMGTALFISVMSIVAASQVTAGATPVEAELSGIRAAFFVGACLSLIPVAIAPFVRRSEQSEDAPIAAH